MTDKATLDILTEVHTDVRWIKKNMMDQEKRIRALERWRNIIGGAGTLLTAWVGGGHFLRVMIAAVALSMLMPSPAPGQPTVDARRAAIIEKVRSIGVYPGAEFEVFGAVYRVESVTVDANYTLVVKTKLVR